MKHRQITLIVIFALAILMAPSVSDAQQKPGVYRIGVLGISTMGFETDSHNCPVKGHPNWQAGIEGLQEHGYIRGRNLVLECRWTEGQEDRAPSLAAELVSLTPDLLWAQGGAQVRAAKLATGTIPIVMTGVLDPVGRGMVPSLARPGGNVTGLTDTLAEMEGKRLQLLKEFAPKVSRVAVLYVLPAGPGLDKWKEYLEAPAKSLGLRLQYYGVKGVDELADVFSAMSRAEEEALFLVPHGFWAMEDYPKRVADLARQYRMPSTFQSRGFVEAGGLMAYHVDMPAIRRRIGVYVDKILKGANPGDLPVEQPTKFNLVINLKTAKALGLTIPQSLLVLADEVIN